MSERKFSVISEQEKGQKERSNKKVKPNEGSESEYALGMEDASYEMVEDEGDKSSKGLYKESLMKPVWDVNNIPFVLDEDLPENKCGGQNEHADSRCNMVVQKSPVEVHTVTGTKENLPNMETQLIEQVSDANPDNPADDLEGEENQEEANCFAKKEAATFTAPKSKGNGKLQNGDSGFRGSRFNAIGEEEPMTDLDNDTVTTNTHVGNEGRLIAPIKDKVVVKLRNTTGGKNPQSKPGSSRIHPGKEGRPKPVQREPKEIGSGPKPVVKTPQLEAGPSDNDKALLKAKEEEVLQRMKIISKDNPSAGLNHVTQVLMPSTEIMNFVYQRKEHLGYDTPHKPPDDATDGEQTLDSQPTHMEYISVTYSQERYWP
ncbi:hypothetical protein RIF29_39004 [Crotalaria pallida]|uniref:Uncharacterized protein n=1 Tax=Crotalaria pallida TaxID=3830 RepID=A0AAN9HPF1_CROPI